MKLKINYIFIDPEAPASETFAKIVKETKLHYVNIVKSKTWSSSN